MGSCNILFSILCSLLGIIGNMLMILLSSKRLNILKLFSVFKNKLDVGDQTETQNKVKLLLIY